MRGEPSELQLWREIYKKYYQANRFAFFIDNQQAVPFPLDQKKPLNTAVAYFCQGNTCLAPIQNLKEFEYELRRNEN